MFRGSAWNRDSPPRILGIVPTSTGAATGSTDPAAQADGGLFALGDAAFRGSTSGMKLARPIVGMAAGASGGYWLAGQDGAVFPFGDAPFGGPLLSRRTVGGEASFTIRALGEGTTATSAWAEGSSARVDSDPLTTTWSAAAPTPAPVIPPAANGYWMVASDGGIFAFGDAAFHGSTGNLRLAKPIVGMTGTPSGDGYWLVASDGGIFAFGDAAFHGSTGDIRLAKPIVGMTATPSGDGYWISTASGRVLNFGDADPMGSLGARPALPVVSMTPLG